jgi:hypothetical protein
VAVLVLHRWQGRAKPGEKGRALADLPVLSDLLQIVRSAHGRTLQHAQPSS